MLGWLLVAVALAALLLDPGLWSTVAVAVAVLVYLLVRGRSWGELEPETEVRDVDGEAHDEREESSGSEGEP